MKTETQASHAALEATIHLMDRLQCDADYRKLLEAFYGIFVPIEASLLRDAIELGTWIPDLEKRSRANSLRRDLIALGNTAPEQLPQASVPEHRSTAQKLGCLYVLEGSTLGGQVISRQVHSALGYTAEHGCEYFFGHGSLTGEMWQRFRYCLESYAAATPDEHTAIIESALRTFQVFDDWMRVKL